MAWHLVVFQIQGALLISLNITLVFFIIFKKKLRTRYNNQFLVNLFIAHIIEGFVAIARSTFLYSKPRDPYKVSLSVHLFTASTLLSYLATLPVTGDRLVAIRWPFVYQKLTSTHVILTNSCVWVIVAIYTAFAMALNFNSKVGDTITMTMTVIMYIFSSIANFQIYKVVRIQIEEIKKLLVKRRSNSGATSSIVQSSDGRELASEDNIKKLSKQEGLEQQSPPTVSSPLPGHCQKKSQGVPSTRRGTLSDQKKEKKHPNADKIAIHKRRLRSAYICTGIVISFAVCWTPHAVHDLLKVTNAAPSIVYSDSELARSTIIIAFCNGILDPIIYVLLNKDLKCEIRKIKNRVFHRGTGPS